MKIILENPYRITGLLAGTSTREQNRQIRRLQQFLEAEQEVQDDYSLPVLGPIRRSVEMIVDAASKLDLDSDKLHSSLFWFYIGNNITDEPAINALKERDLYQAINIWKKIIANQEVTLRNASAFHNLSTLYLSGILEGTDTFENILEKALILKLKFIESDHFIQFERQIVDLTYKSSKKELQITFLSQVFSEIEKNTKSEVQTFLDILAKQKFLAKEDFLNKVAEKHIERIEKKIEDIIQKRRKNKSNSDILGRVLYDELTKELGSIKSILGQSNYQFITISDKVADEILQCGIDYFLNYRDSSTDPGSNSMDLFRKAKIIAIGTVTKQRCQENIEKLQEWIENKPERDKQARILVDFEKLKILIEEYGARSKTVANAKLLLASAKPYLINVKNVLGSTDELYLGLSSRIASDAQGMCVSEINNLQERFSNTYNNATKLAEILLLRERVNEAWDVTTTIGSMDLRQDFRTRYTQNRTSLSNLKTQLAVINIGGGSSGRGSTGSGGCYIATMAYGDYDHPQVIILRQFRDEVLDKSALGKWFIKTYYHYSPRLVERLKNQRTVNIIIRKALNQFIKLIK